MSWNLTIYSISGIVAASISFILAFYSWRLYDEHGSQNFAYLMVMLGGWSLAYSIQLGFNTLSEQLVWQRIGLAIGGTIPTLWLLFTLSYAGKNNWMTPGKQGLLFIDPVLFAILLLTNPSHELVFSGVKMVQSTAGLVLSPIFAIGYYIHILYAYLTIGAGIGLLLYVYIRNPKTHRKQAGLLIFGALLPSVGNIAYTLQVSWGPLPAIDPTPFMFVLTGVLFGLALFQFDLLERTPIARQHVLEEMGDGLIVLDTDGQVIDSNIIARNIFGPTPSINEILTKWDLSSTDTIEETLKSLDKQTLVITVNGHEQSYDVDWSELTDHRDENIGHVLSFRDVTERAEYQRQNEELEEFASTVSHDLRNPLNIASGHLELARQKADSDHLTAVANAHERMEQLIDELLTIAREGKRIEKKERTEIGALFQNCWQNVETKNATLIIETDLTVLADQSRLQQLAENLIRNAVEHGGSDVMITIATLEEEDGFYVADDGPGIPENERKDVFKRGYSNAVDGSGFGLGIVNKIVDAHGWDISVTASQEGGAKFEITGVEQE